MFEQIVGDGANLFIIIVSVIVGFVAALGRVDINKTEREKSRKNTSGSGN